MSNPALRASETTTTGCLSPDDCKYVAPEETPLHPATCRCLKCETPYVQDYPALPAVLPTADAPTAERLAHILEWVIGAAWGLEPDEVADLQAFASRLPSLIAADADRQRLTEFVALVKAGRVYISHNDVFELRTAYPDSGWRVQTFATLDDMLRASRSPEGGPNGL